MIELKGVRKSFGSLEVLKGIDAEVSKGEVVCVIGPSGSGKSTILRCINGLERYNAGRITVDAVSYTHLDVYKRQVLHHEEP